MASGGGLARKNQLSTNSSLRGRKNASDNERGPDSPKKTVNPSQGPTGERTVRRLRLSKALTIPENTTILDACRRMAARKVDALLLTDANALLCGILTDKDIAARVVAQEVAIEDTPVSKIMTRNPVFVFSDTLAVEALQKMVQGKFRHLPVVENGEVIALLDIAKCLYDTIARLERAAEKRKAIAATVEGAEKNWGPSISGPSTFFEAIREKMFWPALSMLIPENTKTVTVSPTETVLSTAKKMLEFHSSSAVVAVDDKPQGILTSKDILMRVIAQNISPDSTLVEKVMTPNPVCATIETPIVDALHSMHDGKFLHLPVVDSDGNVMAVVDVIQITHAAVATVGNTSGINNEATNSLMQKFWDSAMNLSLNDDDETRSDGSLKLASDGTEMGRSLVPFPSPVPQNTFAFKIEDRKGRLHRFSCETQRLTDLVTVILGRLGDDIDRNNLPRILYEDAEHDRIVMDSDTDLAMAVEHARLSGLKGLRLHLDYSGYGNGSGAGAMEYYVNTDAWAAAYSAVAAGAALVAGLSLLAYIRRSSY